MNERFHGGIKNNTIDFSVNLNPLIEEVVIKNLVCKHYKKAINYPEQRGETLVNLISEKYKISVSNIVLGNGSIEIFYALPKVLNVSRVITLEPTFCEYRYIANINNVEYEPLLWDKNLNWDFNHLRKNLKKGDLLFICNPNNPTGDIFHKEDILSLLDTSAYIVVDEAFMDFTNVDQSVLSEVFKFENLIVVRSLTKIFSIAGLRVGFCVASKKIINELKKVLPLWNVNGIALAVAEQLLKRDDIISQTKDYIEKEKRYFLKELSNLNLFKIHNTYANFFLAQSEKTGDFIDFLAKHNVSVRDFRGFYGLNENYFRFAIKRKGENRLLVSLFKEFEGVKN